MDQESIVQYLALKGMSAVEIHKDLVATLKDEAVAYSTVTRYLRSTSFSAPADASTDRRTKSTKK
jgi:hypothetical protein